MPKFKSSYFDPGNKYHAPYQWGFAGVVYRKDRIQEEDTQSWSLLFNPEKKPGSFYLLDSQQEMLSIALNYLDYDPNSVKPAELKAAMDLLVKTKKRQNCMGFKGGVGANNEVAAGTVNASIVYNGDALRVIDENPKVLGFIMPNEGSFMFLDSLVIPREAPNPEAAYKWINWILEPKVGAALSNFNRFGTPNQASLPFINKDDLKNPAIYPSEQAMEKIFYLKDPGENMKILDQAWTRVKSQ